MTQPRRVPLAVVGLGCRFSGADDPSSLVAALEEPRARFVPLPEERWPAGALDVELPAGKMGAAPTAALLERFDLDWRALRMPPHAAEHMHRMERVALTTMAAALFDAGITREARNLEGARVFIAAPTMAVDPLTDHGRRIRRFELAAPVSEALAEHLPGERAAIDQLVEQLFNLAAPPIDPDSMTTSATIAAGRTTNLFDLRGGHMSVDAGMSSSLAALEAASAALSTGSCDLALICGVSPLVTASQVLSFAHKGYLGEGRPAPFSPSSSGTLLGEGCAALVLVRKDEVGERRCYAVVDGIASSAVVPTKAADAAVADAAARALSSSGAAPDDVFGVITRAAGLYTADALEARGLAAAYGGAARREALRVSSSVGQFGYLQGAAGMLALVEAVVALSRGRWFGGDGAADLDVPGLCGERGRALPQGARLAVSDAGLSPTTYHAVLASADAPMKSAAVTRRVPLAIVGVGAVAPEAPDAEALWRNVLLGVHAVGDLPPSRWDVDALVGGSVDAGAVLKTRLAGTVRLPDAEGPRPSTSEVALADADPAIRLALAAAGEALQGGKLARGVDGARAMVAIGQLPLRWSEMELEKRVLFQGHLALCAQAMREADIDDATAKKVIEDARRRFDQKTRPLSSSSLDAFSGSAAPHDVAARFGLTGEALSVDAACASSLAALELAADRIALGEIDLAVVGGVAFNLVPEYYISLSMLGALSPRGAPPFDVGSDGFVPAEGAGIIVVKRHSDALAAGDDVLAVVKSIGVSSDGRGLSIFAPRKEGQVLAMARALEAAATPAEEVDYIEAHGTGTKLGDSTELSACAEVYGQRDPAMPVAIGTIKSQIGHQSSAAGGVAVVKTALALKRRTLPPSNADTQPDPSSPFFDAPLALSSTPRQWVTRPNHRRTAAVSAFGIGGINYHVILEEPPHGERDEMEPAGALRRGPIAPLPPRGTEADRFVVELAPVALPRRKRLFSLKNKRVLIVPDPAGVLALALERALSLRGAKPLVLPADEVVDAAAIQGAIGRFGAKNVGALFDLSAFSARARLEEAGLDDFGKVAREHLARCVATGSALYEALEEAPPLSKAYVVVTSLGGDLGLLGTSDGDLLGAASLGFVKGLKQELPRVLAKGVDFSAQEDPERVVQQLLDEVEDGNDRMEVGYLGRRMVPHLRREPFFDERPHLRTPQPGDVWLFSGGGRGVVFECAMGLARLGVKAVVCGRTPPPPDGLEVLALNDDQLDEYKKSELQRRRKADPTLTPVRFEQEMEVLRHQRELWRNLKRARDQGLALEYVVCDITAQPDVKQLIADVRARYGRLDGVVHGAMVEWSKSLPKKSARQVERTLDTKVGGLLNLLDAVKDAPPPQLLCFGSGAGRFGNRGQTDYAAANNLMAALLMSWARAQRYEGRASTIDWTAWRGTGAAVATPEMAEIVKATGVSSIGIEEGVYWFLSELGLGNDGETLICAERMVHDWPFLGPAADGTAERTLDVDDRGALLVPGRWPLVDRVLERDEGRVVMERRLDVGWDHFLPQHTLHGEPILPATFGCEVLAEAAAIASPGWEVVSASDVVIGVPVKLHGGRSMFIRATATLVGERDGARTVDVQTTSSLYLKGKVVQESRVHHQGRFTLCPQGWRRTRQQPLEEPTGRAHARSFFHMAKKPVGLGPIYSRAEWIHVLDDGAAGRVRAPRMRDILRSTSWPVFEVDPLVLDGAFQVAANWDGYQNNWVNIPFGVKQLVVGRKRLRGENARVRSWITRVEDPDVYYDVVVIGEDDAVLFDVQGLHMRRIAREEEDGAAGA